MLSPDHDLRPNKSEHATFSQPRVREGVWSTVEQELACMKIAWQTAQALPRVHPFQTDEQVAQEEDSIRNAMNSTCDAFPRGLLKMHRFLVTEAEYKKSMEGIDAISSGAINVNDLSIEQQLAYFEDFSMAQFLEPLRDALLQDKERRFFTEINDGLMRLMFRRQDIRRIYQDLGERWCDPDAYDDLLPKKVKGYYANKVVSVAPGRFSIGLNIPDDDFDAYHINEGDTQYINAFHMGGTLFNFIRESRMGYSTTYDHEDFHAFADEFPSLKEGNSDSLQGSEREAAIKSSLNVLKSIAKAGPLEQDILGTMQDEVLELINMDREELLAEIASLPVKEIPSRTYAGKVNDRRTLLRGTICGDPTIDTFIRRVLPLVDTGELQKRISAMYERIEKVAPDRKIDLDVAFARFPITKIRHIERLVDRWCGPEEKVIVDLAPKDPKPKGRKPLIWY